MNKIITLLILFLFFIGISFLPGCKPAFLVKPSPVPSTSPLPEETAPDKTTLQIEIIDGNVCRVDPGGETKILVDKKDFAGVDYFADPQISPDKTKICFLAYTITPIWLYYSNIDGSEATQIDLAKNCSWSYGSQKIAYNNHTTDVSPVDVLVYDTLSKEKTNLTNGVQSDSIFRVYELPQWSNDDSKIISSFGGLDFNDPQNQIQGTSVIDLATGVITDQ